MTEHDFLFSDDFGGLLDFLSGRPGAFYNGPGGIKPPRRLINDRQLRLFACGCCYHAAKWIPESLRAIAAAEMFADGLQEAWTIGYYDTWLSQRLYEAVNHVTSERILSLVRHLGGVVHRQKGTDFVSVPVADVGNTPKVFVNSVVIIRDIVGNVFKPLSLPPGEERPCSCAMYGRAGLVFGVKTWEKCDCCKGLGKLIQPCSWLTWNNGIVPRIAQSIYDTGNFEDMPILADALQDAGCDNQVILAHLRNLEPCPECPSPAHCRKASAKCKDCGCTGWCRRRMPAIHVRGCYILDLLLDKS